MGQQIIKQPNGKFALWSSIVDSFVMLDAEPKDIVDEWIADERQRVERAVTEIVDKLNRGEPAYYQFSMTWEEALATHEQVHGAPFAATTGEKG